MDGEKVTPGTVTKEPSPVYTPSPVYPLTQAAFKNIITLYLVYHLTNEYQIRSGFI